MLFSKTFSQGQDDVSPENVFRPSELYRTLPFLEPFTLRKLYLVYSRAEQKNLATEVLDQLLDHMKRNEKLRGEQFNMIMKSKGLEGRPWSWPVVEAILESDLFEDTKG